jgi:hypothetical protein
LLGDRRLRTFVEPSPIGLVALPLTLVGLAAPGRAKLLEVQAEADQPERALAIRIRATIVPDLREDRNVRSNVLARDFVKI